ncbi:hypothetical protein MCELHM10_00835 [Paracoccaceae bacterium]
MGANDLLVRIQANGVNPFQFALTAEVFAYVDTGHAKGKVVVTVYRPHIDNKGRAASLRPLFHQGIGSKDV